MGSAILFEVADKGVNFLDELELSAEDAFSATAPRMGRPNAREEAATDFIRSLLAGGRRLASDYEANVSQKVLTAQLRAMEESGLVHREVYAEVPPRVEYSLTELGKSLKPILDSMWTWGEEYKSSIAAK